MRSAALPNAAAPRAADRSGSIAPPRTTMPSGSPFPAFHGGNRVSRGTSNRFPRGEKPANYIGGDTCGDKFTTNRGIPRPHQYQSYNTDQTDYDSANDQ